ncbi:MAG: PTS sugar transporter subunit IIA [Clostridiales bacterium]|nr:PTS sugar transporter subunit IIA [Clostridiales bacterium]
MEKEESLHFGKEDEVWLLGEFHHIFNLDNLEKSESLSLAMVDNILLETSKKLGREYYNDAELRASLQKHLISLIENSFVSYETDAGNLKAIVEENPALYHSIRHCLDQAGEELHVDPETESALLMLHFLAADERRYMKVSVNYSALVVCNNGVGTAKIVSVRLKKYFPQLRIIGATAARSAVQEISVEKPDFIISTTAFEYQNIPVVRVNPFPTEDDLDKIRIFLESSENLNRNLPGKSVYSRVMDAVLATCVVRDREELERRLAGIFPREEKLPELLESLKEQDIQVKIGVESWEEAIRRSAQPLVEQGYVTEGYVDCMVNNVKKMGPYIVITRGIALPHAFATEGVIRSCISLATLSRPVEFGNKINDPVSLVICIAVSDKKEHMREMAHLIDLISDKEAVQKIQDAGSAAEILAIIRQTKKKPTQQEAGKVV